MDSKLTYSAGLKGNRSNLIILLVVAAAVLVLPVLMQGSPFHMHVILMILLYASMGQAWNIVSGYAGQVSLGHCVFFGIGAYTSSMFVLKSGLTPWVGMFIGVFFSLVMALVIGSICFKLKGHYFVIATFVIAEIVLSLVSTIDYFGAAVGLWLPIKAGLLNLQFKSKLPYYYIFLAFTMIVFGFTWYMERSRMGYYFRAIKADPDAAQALGVNIYRYKMYAMLWSAAFSSVLGTLYAQYVLLLDPNNIFVMKVSLIMALVTVLGGVSTLWGPLIGSAILIPLSEYSRVWFSGGGKALDLIIYGSLIVLISIFEPDGIIGLLNRIKTKITGS
ncbi:MAG: branched-chain amino acid ABC transporter permease [Desulfocucumaceae bacterium]